MTRPVVNWRMVAQLQNRQQGGLTYNSHPLACAAALATIAAYEEDNLIEKARQTGHLMAALLADLAARHPSVGAVRSIGLFGVVELVRSKKTLDTMTPFNSTSPEMAAFAIIDRGLAITDTAVT